MPLPAATRAKLHTDGVPKTDVDSLIAKLELCADDAESQKCFDAFCANHRLRGTPVHLEESEKVGRLAFKSAFARRLTRTLLGLGNYFDEDAVEGLLDSLFDPGSPYEERELMEWLFDVAGDIPITGVSLSDPKESHLATLTWLFRNPARSRISAREGLDVAKLPHFLGLDAKSGDHYIGFDVDAAHAKSARHPTVFDIAWTMISIFELGGRTKPTGGYPLTDGLEEAVAIPPHLRSIHGRPIGIVAK